MALTLISLEDLSIKEKVGRQNKIARPTLGTCPLLVVGSLGRNDYFVVIPLAAPQGLSPNNEFSLVFLQMTVDKAPREINPNSLCVLCSSFTSVCIIYLVFVFCFC